MERTKEFRIHQKERKVNKAYRILKEWNLAQETDGQIKSRAKKMADNMKCTKCECCCNPRHSSLYKAKSRLTIQERKAPDPEKELEDV